ncbi:HesA/MoeB/ThiF family protein [Donghicola sp. C2-DW-16]|uniref:HesA/MoeB/ThiF family protein n=1 Tax=Donghicola mangrovi TaxID=2729614 RepID=A0ABX2PAZ0_9RHOB|nr:HesA/MoeB/ThiF family protein [Donghicola mangrovi]NVO26636.1 HesA/MoeB/ThiF family protein [Donghicola mangrovi]
MLLFLVMAGALWGIGVLMKTPKSARWVMILILYFAVLAAHLVLPDGAPLRISLGGSKEPWLIVGGLIGLALVYRVGLRAIRTKIAEKEAPMADAKPKSTFEPVELERYARHIVLREIGGPGQKALKEAKVLVVGAGGLGSPALLYLAAAGVGTIGVIDADEVDNGNLQRQVLHADADIGRPKVFSAQDHMLALNPFVTVKPYHRRLTEDFAEELIGEYDLVLDGTDNFATRYLTNRICAKLGKPLISGALTQWEGQLSLFDPANGTPCYQCIFPEAPAPHLAPACAEAGVAGPLPGIIGSMMAMEAVKDITGAGQTVRGRMVIHDALYAETRSITLRARADCPVCGHHKD